MSGSGDDAEVRVLPTEEAEPQPLVFHHMPIAASLGFFRAAEGGGAPITVLDPGDREELVRHRGVVVAVAVAVAVVVVMAVAVAVVGAVVAAVAEAVKQAEAAWAGAASARSGLFRQGEYK